jgi:O-acetyl-ADP-ribose deacetylase (regulator of RNase III)
MKFVNGDLIELAKQGKFDVIIHGCNCFNTMGAGIAKNIKKIWPVSYMEDYKTIKGDKNKLGTYTMVNVGNLIIVNAYTQYKYGANQDYETNYKAIQSVFKKIKTDFTGKKIGFPKIGAGLAGGDWSIISNIIDNELNGEDYTCVLYI